MKHTSNNIRNDCILNDFSKKKKSYLTLDRYLLGVHHLARINNHCRSVDLPRASRQIEASYFFVPPYHQCCATPWHGPTCYLMCRDEVGNNFPCPNNRWWHKQHTHKIFFGQQLLQWLAALTTASSGSCKAQWFFIYIYHIPRVYLKFIFINK